MRTQTNGRFQFLDGLRGIAALWVVFLHFHTLINERSSTRFPFLWDILFKNGHMGVNIFFVLSGFVIAYSIRYQVISFAFIGRFFIRRSIRLDPPYWASLLLLTGLIAIGPLLFQRGYEYLPTLKEFSLNAFYLQLFFGLQSILPVAWTLCLEFQFYFVFVLLLKIVQYFNQQADLAAFNYSSIFSVLFFGTLFVMSLMQASGVDQVFIIPGLFLPQWYSFFIGSLLCWTFLNFIPTSYLFLSISLVALFFIGGNNPDLLITCSIALFILFCIKREKLHSFLSSSFFQYLGKISYSLYLVHWCVGIKFLSLIAYLLGDTMDKISPLVLLFISTALSVGAASLFYRLVEYPCICWSKKIKPESEAIKKILKIMKLSEKVRED